MSQTWAYCPDRHDVCGTMIADAERATRDAARIAELGEELVRERERVSCLAAAVAERNQRLLELDQQLVEVHKLRLMAERAAADENANAADLRRARAEIRDLERENASLRRRLREGGR